MIVFGRQYMRGLEGVGGALMLTDCVCTAVFSTRGWGALGNHIGDTGGVALAKAVESGRCQLTDLDLACKSKRVLPHALLGLGLSFPAAAVMVRSVGYTWAGGRGRRIDADRLRGRR